MLACSAAFVGALGLPRWVVARMTKRRQNKFIDEFANAIDVIVRGVKSGLPLNECLGIIARESAAADRARSSSELVEQQRVGVPLAEALRAHDDAHAAAGGAASSPSSSPSSSRPAATCPRRSATSSGVLRDRKRLQAKVKALSAEAKASAVRARRRCRSCVMIMVYITTPNYIALLWTTKMRPVSAAGRAASG